MDVIGAGGACYQCICLLPAGINHPGRALRHHPIGYLPHQLIVGSMLVGERGRFIPQRFVQQHGGQCLPVMSAAQPHKQLGLQFCPRSAGQLLDFGVAFEIRVSRKGGLLGGQRLGLAPALFLKRPQPDPQLRLLTVQRQTQFTKRQRIIGVTERLQLLRADMGIFCL